MTAHRDDRSDDHSADMETRLEQLDEDIDEARKKAQDGRAQGDTPEGDALDDVAGGGTDHAEHVDDPEASPIIGPA